jgi:hypothetical protein
MKGKQKPDGVGVFTIEGLPSKRSFAKWALHYPNALQLVFENYAS